LVESLLKVLPQKKIKMKVTTITTTTTTTAAAAAAAACHIFTTANNKES
jgi:hypothetical protein